MGQGVFFIWTWGAHIEVKGNSFKNVSRNSIESLDNYRDNEGRGQVFIRNNKMITPTAGCPFPGPTSYPNGIVAGWFLDPAGGQDPVKNSKIVVMNNYIEAKGELSAGIISMADGMTIVNNEIILSGGSKSKAIVHTGSHGFVADNNIKGLGPCLIETYRRGATTHLSTTKLDSLRLPRPTSSARETATPLWAVHVIFKTREK
jgi:hypothetical protein